MTGIATRLALGAGLLFAGLLAACDDASDQGAQGQGGGGGGGRPPQAVSVVTVQPQAIPLVNELPGRIAPTRIAEVRPRVSGIVTERVFRQGSTVQEGDVLYRIDSAPFEVQVQRAQAALERAEAERKAAEQAADRQVELRERNVVSAQQYDDALAQLASANASVAEARAGLNAAQLDLEYTRVRAPISGRIGRARITEGALVSATGGESLATIQQLDPIYADFTQSANELLALRRAYEAGTLAQSESGDAAVRLRFDDGSEYGHVGRLLFSEATVDSTTGQVTLRGEFPNPDGDLLPGMYMRVLIEQGVEQSALAVPKQAVQRDMGGDPQLQLVGEEDKVEVRSVTLGRVFEDLWVVEKGLSAGDRVIVEGFQKIGPGAPVTPEPWQGRQGAAGGGEDGGGGPDAEGKTADMPGRAG